MKKKMYIIILIFIATTSCDEYVDIQPRGQRIAQTLNDADLLLNAGRRLSDLTEHGSNYFPALLNDNIRANASDIMKMNELSNTANYGRFAADIFLLKTSFYKNDQTDDHWGSAYKVIGICNYVIEILNNINPVTNEDIKFRKQLMGEALTHRAFYYFRLVNMYGVHYGLPEATNTESGVPVITEFGDNKLSIVRKSVNDIYDLMEKDLTEAISMLNEQSSNLDRPKKASAFGLLARVYLHMGNYAMAQQNAESGLNSYNVLYNYNTLTRSNRPTQLNNVEHVLLKQCLPSFIRGSNYVNTFFNRFSPELEALYDVKDLRLNEYTLLEGNYTFGGDSRSIFRKYISVGVTTPELYLIKAESMARTGSFSQAINVVNSLRETRFSVADVTLGNHRLIATSQDEAVKLILEERRREFHISGMRFFDIKRLNAIENAGISLTRGGVTFSANSINWALPIGQGVIDSSEGQIKQNPRE